MLANSPVLGTAADLFHLLVYLMPSDSDVAIGFMAVFVDHRCGHNVNGLKAGRFILLLIARCQLPANEIGQALRKGSGSSPWSSRLSRKRRAYRRVWLPFRR